MTGLLLHVALFPPGTTHDSAIGQAGPSILSRLPPAILKEDVSLSGNHLRISKGLQAVGGPGMRKMLFFSVVGASLLSGCGTATLSTAQGNDPSRFTYTWVYCTPDAESHFQNVTVDLRKISFAPPAPRSTLAAAFPPQAPSSEHSSRVGAPRILRIVSITLFQRSTSLRSCRGCCRSSRPTVRPDDSEPAMWSA